MRDSMYRQFRIPETQITAKHERDKNVFEATGNTRGSEDESYKLFRDLDFLFVWMFSHFLLSYSRPCHSSHQFRS